MAEGFKLIPEEMPVIARGRRTSKYSVLLAEALEALSAQPKAKSLRVEVPEGVKVSAAYNSLRAQAKKPEFAGKLSVHNVAGTLYIAREKKTAKK